MKQLSQQYPEPNAMLLYCDDCKRLYPMSQAVFNLFNLAHKPQYCPATPLYQNSHRMKIAASVI